MLMISDKNDDIHLLNNNNKVYISQILFTPPKKNKKKIRGFDWKRWLKYLSLIALVIQNAGQTFIMRHAKTRSNNDKFLNTVAVFYNEIIKLFVSFIIFILLNKSFKNGMKELKFHFFINFLDTLKVSIPALVYTIQNVLLYVAIEHLDVSTFMITYQIKILTTAAFAVLLLRKKLSIMQWVSLFALIAGIILVQLNTSQIPSPKNVSNFSSENFTFSQSEVVVAVVENHGNPLFGLSMVAIACLLSGFAGVYFEKILKESDVSLWMRSIQLSVFSIPCCALLIGIKDYDSVIENGFMQGFDYLVWIVVLIHAAGGLIVSIVIKYADNILKAFATSIAIFIAIIFTTAASVYFYSSWPPIAFIIGAILVIVAVIVYGMFPYKYKLIDEPIIESESETESETTTLETNSEIQKV